MRRLIFLATISTNIIGPECHYCSDRGRRAILATTRKRAIEESRILMLADLLNKTITSKLTCYPLSGGPIIIAQVPFCENPFASDSLRGFFFFPIVGYKLVIACRPLLRLVNSAIRICVRAPFHILPRIDFILPRNRHSLRKMFREIKNYGTRV